MPKFEVFLRKYRLLRPYEAVRIFFVRTKSRTQYGIERLWGLALGYERDCPTYELHDWKSNSAIGVTCQRCGYVCMDGSFYGYDEEVRARHRDSAGA